MSYTKEFKLLQQVLTLAKPNNVQSVLNTIDQFCSTSWMMNVGPVKGAILDAEIKKRNPQTMLELGTYCGYSTTRICSQLSDTSRLYSLDVNATVQGIALKILQHAGLDKKVTLICGEPAVTLPKLMKEQKLASFDMIFIDHDKRYYLRDFKLLESLGLIAPNTVIVADNMIYPGAPDYLEYITKTKEDIYESVLHKDKVFVEYSSEPDAVLVATRKKKETITDQ